MRFLQAGLSSHWHVWGLGQLYIGNLQKGKCGRAPITGSQPVSCMLAAEVKAPKPPRKCTGLFCHRSSAIRPNNAGATSACDRSSPGRRQNRKNNSNTPCTQI